MRRTIPLLCLITLHTPDGVELPIDTRHIVALRPATNIKQHLAHGTKTVVYVTTQNFGVTETVAEIEHAIHVCINGDDK